MRAILVLSLVPALLTADVPASATGMAAGPGLTAGEAPVFLKSGVPALPCGGFALNAASRATGDDARSAAAASRVPGPDTFPPEYYAIELIPTRRVPGTGAATGRAWVRFAPSPFGVAVAPGGSYVVDLEVEVRGLRPPRRGVYAAWVTTRELDQVELLGPLDEAFRAAGRSAWNKFLVVVTLEPSAENLGPVWQGPVVLRGMSRSGMMHTMAGHGPFEQEPCAKYGYD